MPKVSVYNIEGKKVSDIDLKEEIFGIEPNEAVIHSVLVNFLANQRQGTQSTKTRSEVSGGGRKPWRQKGTGRARQGSIRAPQWITWSPKTTKPAMDKVSVMGQMGRSRTRPAIFIL